MLLRSSVNYVGSKLGYVNEIAPMIPLHKKGLDLFGGSAAIALNFHLAYNDKDDYAARCFKELKQEELDRLIMKYSLDSDLKPYTSGDFRVNTINYKKLVDAYKLDSDNLHLKYLVKFFAHSMDGNIDPLKSKIRAGKFRRPELKNQEIFLRRAITHKDFRDIDFNEYDFIFIDPPYLNSDFRFQYGGWSVDDELALIAKLASYNGKFLMTNYLNKYLQESALKYNWGIKKIATKMNSANFIKHTKEEYFIYNYKVGFYFN